MKTFEIKYYGTDYGGMRDELDKVEYFEGTYEEAVEKVENTSYGWGGFYKVGKNSEYTGGGKAFIKEITTREIDLVNKIAELQRELEILRGES